MIFHALCAVWLFYFYPSWQLESTLKNSLSLLSWRNWPCARLRWPPESEKSRSPCSYSRGEGIWAAIISSMRHVRSFGKSPLRRASRSRSSSLPWAQASVCFLSCGRRIQPGPFVSISTGFCCERIMLADPEQLDVLKITVFRGAASWFTKLWGACVDTLPLDQLQQRWRSEGSAERQHFAVGELWH